MLFFILLAGVRDSTPLNEIFFIQFDTNSIADNIPNPVRWTLYNYCGVSSNGKNIDCSSNTAGIAFQPQETFGTTNGIPTDFIDNRDTYYYLTKIGFSFYIITAGFTVISFFMTIFSCFSRLGGAISAFFAFVALLFSAAASSMMTAAFVMARNKFTDIGTPANIGVKAFAFTWAVTASLLLSFILMCCSCTGGISGRPYGRRRKSNGLENTSTSPLKRESSFERVYDNDKPRGRGFFNVSRRKEEQPTSFFAENNVNPPPGPLVIDNRA